MVQPRSIGHLGRLGVGIQRLLAQQQRIDRRPGEQRGALHRQRVLWRGRDIEQAIVGPARRVLKSWDIDPGVSETGPFTEQALSTLRHVFDDGRELLPHPADQLPLMQHLLPLVWDHAVERWQADADDRPFQIDLADIRTLPGWSGPEGPLVGTLNTTGFNLAPGYAFDVAAAVAQGTFAIWTVDRVEEAVELFLACPAAEAYEKTAATLKTFDDLIRDRLVPDPWRAQPRTVGMQPEDPD